VRDPSLPCEEARGLLDERLDRTLEPAEASVLAAHLDRCASCRAAADALDGVHGALLSMDPPDPGPAFTDRVVASLDRAPGTGAAVPRSDGRRILRGLAAAAGTAVFAAAALLLLPVDAASATLGGYVPDPALPSLPDSAARLAAGFVVAIVVAALQVVSVRRRPGRTS
jgi:anti-sigma factor RsiW